ncbi:MAG: hypothetical protein V1809_12940 [Planctomycetota bacterium]
MVARGEIRRGARGDDRVFQEMTQGKLDVTNCDIQCGEVAFRMMMQERSCLGGILVVVGTILYFVGIVLSGMAKTRNPPVIFDCLVYSAMALIVTGIVIGFRRKERGRAFLLTSLLFVVIGTFFMVGFVIELLWARIFEFVPFALAVVHGGIGLALWYLGRTVPGNGNPGV